MKRNATGPAAFTLAALVGAVVATAGGDRIEVSAPADTILRRAGQERPPLWRVPLGSVLVEEMRLLSPAKLLVGLREEALGLPNHDYLLLNTASGAVLWRYERKRRRGLFDLLVASENVLLFRVSEGTKMSLLALDGPTGTEKWSAAFAGGASFLPGPAQETVFTVEPSRSRVRLSALGIADGIAAWSREIEAPEEENAPAGPSIVSGDLVHFYGGATRLSGKDGRTVWSRDDLIVSATSPPPQVDAGDLLLVDARGALSLLNGATGETRWTTSLPSGVDYANIYPDAERVYLRGLRKQGGGATAPHVLLSVQRKDGKLLWTHTHDRPSLSNLVEDEGRLFYGTPNAIVVLHADTGALLSILEVAKTGRAYPVRIRVYPDRVAYISELIVAAFEPLTGRKLYSHGLTPVSLETSLATLDESIPRLKQEVSALSGGTASPPAYSGAALTSSFARLEVRKYQNMANDYSQLARAHSQKGEFATAQAYRAGAVEARTAEIRAAETAIKAERQQAWMNFASSVMQLADAFLQARELAASKTNLERQELFRKSILRAYGQMETDEYVYRPGRSLGSAKGDFSTLAVVHLTTGKMRETYLSATYLSNGLWNVIDFDKGVAYHHGIGLDPSLYEFSEPHQVPPFGKNQTVKSFLIAAPVTIPE